ncbi:MAG TPA: thiamine phosphate synthase [Sphingomicrobium sp.]
MKARQTGPEQWLILNGTADERAFARIRRLPRGTGVLVLGGLKAAAERRLRTLAREKAITVMAEAPQAAARVHNIRELTQARLRRAKLILISPLYPTRSHPDWEPLGRMRAATLARLAGRRAIALGGMDQQRFDRVRRLGFAGWAGISSWLEP